MQQPLPTNTLPLARDFPRLILFGDSLTEKSFGDGGWCKAVVNNFQRRCDVLNRGFGGYTSAFNKLILPRLLQRDNTPPGCVVGAVILLGSNDAVIKEHDKRHVPLEDYMSNLKEISRQFVEGGIPLERQVFITPPPIVNEKWMEHCKELGRMQNGRYNNVKPYAAACLKLKEEIGVQVVDIWNAMQEQENWEDYFSDGLHFSLEGNSFVAERVVPVLENMLKDLPRVYPEWSDVDTDNPQNSLLL